MENRFLLPHHYRKIGWMIFIPFLVLGIFAIHMDFQFDWLEFKLRPEGGLFDSPEYENFTDELAGIMVLIGLIFIAFSREKIEDEFVMKLRLESLMVAVLINYALLLIAILSLYSFGFFYALVYNMYTILIFFIARFQWVNMRQRKMLQS